jgi:raffinose/stachyose/melibiose transport system permease protein
MYQRYPGLSDEETGGRGIMKNTTIGGNKRKAVNFLAITGLVIIFAAYMFPFLMVVINSLKQKRDIIKSPFSWLYTIKGLSFDNFVKAFTQMDFLNAFKNSLIVTVSATVLVTLLAAMLAYYIVRHNNGISKLTFALMVASMIIPFQAIMIPLVSIYGGTLNVLNHRITLIFMHTGFSMAMSVFMFHGFIKGNVPIALEEAAYIDGCTHSQTFFKIVLPLLKPIISTMVILNSMAFWNDFLLPSLVLSDKKLLTLPLSTYSFYGTYSADYGTIMAGLLLCVVPILVLYVALQKQIIGGVVAGAVK